MKKNKAKHKKFFYIVKYFKKNLNLLLADLYFEVLLKRKTK